MAEQLIIRLASQAESTIPWLVWSSAEHEIIASGELANAQQLEQLKEKSLTRQVTVLVPACDVSLKRLHVPAKSKKAMQLAVPYMLEDDLAQEVEQLFFAYAELKHADNADNCFVAIVEREQMRQWRLWLSEAGIETKRMIPDVLLMPDAESHWQAIQLQQQVLLRQGVWQGSAIDDSLWTSISQTWPNDADLHIDAYSALPPTNEAVTLNAQPEELPLALLARQIEQQSFNLLQGEFKVKSARSPALKIWAWAAGFALVALLVNVVLKSVTLMQINQQQSAVEQQIIAQYKKTFPDTKRVRISTIRSQLKRKMAEVGGTSSDAEFLTLLAQVEPAFAKVPSLKPDSLKFDRKRNELRVQASAKGYQQFEQFKQLLEAQQLSVSQGAQNNQGDKVVGSLSITANKGERS